MSGLELVGLSLFFWKETGAKYRAEHARERAEGETGAGTREALKSKVTWLCAAFFFAYMGVEGKSLTTNHTPWPLHRSLWLANSMQI